MKTFAIIYTTAVAIACVYAAAMALNNYVPRPAYPCAVHKHTMTCHHKLP